MENRPTKELRTPNGKQLIVKTYLTAGERNQIRSLFLSKMSIDIKTSETSEVSGSTVEEAEKLYLQLAVVSYDGSAERIHDRLLEASPEEYDFVVKASNDVATGIFQQAK